MLVFPFEPASIWGNLLWFSQGVRPPRLEKSMAPCTPLGLGCSGQGSGTGGPGHPAAGSWRGYVVRKASWRKEQIKDSGVVLTGQRVLESIGARSSL